jgi:rare lipoprotein A
MTAAAAAGLASCAGTAMRSAPDARGSSHRPLPADSAGLARAQPGVTLTPVTVHADGRMTPRAEEAGSTFDGSVLEEAEGEATYYASRFDGRRTASGVVFRNSESIAAHRNWPFGTIVRVTSLVNGRSAIVRIEDRGPHGTSERARRTIIDLSQSTARELDFIRAGRIPVRVEVLEWGSGRR